MLAHRTEVNMRRCSVLCGAVLALFVVSCTKQESVPASADTEKAPSPPAAATPSSKAIETESHENHYHPERTAIQTKTYVVPVGTEVSVRTEETIDSVTAAE